MKYKIFMLIVAVTVCMNGYAQDDDIYFVPSKKEKNVQKQQPAYQEYTDTDWSEGRTNGGRDVDEYNRRGNYDNETTDSTYTEKELLTENGTYTTRLVRFHSPRIGVYVSSPYYVDVYDYYWNYPWYYDPWYDGWYGWGWRPYYGWNSWYGWHHPWYPGWGPSWGWHPPYHPIPGRPNYAYRGPGNRYGGRDNYNSVNRPATYRPSSGRQFSTRPSSNRTNATNGSTRPSTRYNTSTPNNSRPSRSYDNSNSRPSRSYSTPSRSNSGSSYSAPSNSGGRSFGSGGGRSFGSGSSRGGRR